MLPSRQRAFLALISLVVGALMGALGGFLVGRVVLLNLGQKQLTSAILQMTRQVDAELAESQAVLAALRSSTQPACSEAELASMRALLFDSAHLKDVGRLENHHLLCSAVLGKLAAPRSLPASDVELSGGLNIYRNPPLYREDGSTVLALAMEQSYIVLHPAEIPAGMALPMHIANYTSDLRGQALLVRGEEAPVTASSLLRDGEQQTEGWIISTRCSTRGPDCLTGFVSDNDVLATGHLHLLAFVCFGVLSGALGGLLVSLFYRRSQAMDQQLRRALTNETLSVVYQPIVDLSSNRIVGAEALVRWRDEQGFDISPAVFVKVAEERGFLRQLTSFVVRRGLHDLHSTLGKSNSFRLHINVTTTDLAAPDFVPMLETMLMEAEVPPRSIALEISESGTAPPQIVADVIGQLRRCGHRIYIDDFGTGYSSLAALQDLQVDAVKVDSAFTRAIGTEAVTVNILPQIVQMARSLGLEVVIEGIETRAQAEYVRQIDAGLMAQGWFCGYPFPPDEFQSRLKSNESGCIPCTNQ